MKIGGFAVLSVAALFICVAPPVLAGDSTVAESEPRPILFGNPVPGETTADQLEAIQIFKQILFDLEGRYQNEHGERCPHSEIMVTDTKVVPNDQGFRTEQWTVTACGVEYPYAIGLITMGNRTTASATYGTFKQ